MQMGINGTKTVPSGVVSRHSKPCSAARHALRLSASRSYVRSVLEHEEEDAASVEKRAKASRDTAHRHNHFRKQSGQGKLPFFWLMAGA